MSLVDLKTIATSSILCFAVWTDGAASAAAPDAVSLTEQQFVDGFKRAVPAISAVRKNARTPRSGGRGADELGRVLGQ